MQDLILQNRSGKIERSFRTVKDNFINCTDWNSFSSLKDLNEKYTSYIEEKYNNSMHSSINETPKERFMKDYSLLRFLPEETINIMFLHTEKRRVLADATISIRNIIFEVPQKYIKQNIQIRYAPNNLGVAYIYDEYGKLKHEIHPVDKIANSKVKRNTISFKDMIGDDKNV